MQTIAELQLPVETTAGAVGGISLLPATTVEQLLIDKRRIELVQPFKLALLKLASQVRVEGNAFGGVTISYGGRHILAWQSRVI